MSLYESVPISSVWAKLESTYGEIFSLYLKDLLTECAYDSFQSLFNIVSGSIRPMEQDLSNNPRATQRYCDKYKVKQDSFKFKPAHRDIILSIPGICEDLKEEMDKLSSKSSSAPKKKRTSSHESSLVKSSSAPKKKKVSSRGLNPVKSSSALEKKKISFGEKISGGSKCVGTTTIHSLKVVLISKVKRCARETGVKVEDNDIGEQNIIGFDRSSVDGHLYSCQFMCPLCKKPYVVNYKKSWDMSNIRKHFNQKRRSEGTKETIKSNDTVPKFFF
ncbi:uncharacterized protein LOC119066703 isoform X2 [Bradysia coprophila]|uniref:uncharacterized protein LOC119066703 isoform X2 n=1 Tax=Bradysia coprophila TaxID=38358 RepID=UPI00187D8A23|nr:uncharacterized protein LOC119066703 isoform X2 [Bradysia coprophila]